MAGSGGNEFRQEMPRSGGYQDIHWAHRSRPRRFGRYSGVVYFGSFLGLTGVAMWGFTGVFQKRRDFEVEMQDGRIAVAPLLLAEQQRMFLKQLRSNRDEEEELMKDVANWKVGHLYNEPVYHNLSNVWIKPAIEEFYAHNKRQDMLNRAYEKNRLH
ncbi:unnamed protein product [Owenia fusiformis]|uniref:NADH dehydrogenase [ubiquinone] 1 alpha subcomplex subunit 13 n=1 Tax=Owenia fusiformis TaxID=6347 RepID=A0A8J1XUZ3_OWEFU|nr:unnamed protein product [Owenia fusiformis]